MESIAGDRAVLAYDHDEEGALEGAQLISAETDPDLQREQDIFLFINENFAAFLGYLRNLSLGDQELVLSYYLLRKTQTLLAPIFRTSQTLCSTRMRAAVRTMCADITFGGQPTQKTDSADTAGRGRGDPTLRYLAVGEDTSEEVRNIVNGVHAGF